MKNKKLLRVLELTARAYGLVKPLGGAGYFQATVIEGICNGIKDEIAKAKAKGREYTVEEFMASGDEMPESWKVYGLILEKSPEETREWFRQTAEEIIQKEAEDAKGK